AFTSRTSASLCSVTFFSLTLPRPRSTLFPYNDALPISARPACRFPSRRRSSPRSPGSHRPGTRGARGAECRRSSRRGRERRAHRSEEHTSELQSLRHLVCRLLLEKKKKKKINITITIIT